LIDDLFINQDWNHISATLPAANIIEADDHFILNWPLRGRKKVILQSSWMRVY
jgi:hypothetical protein